jgi:hypothetical protein
VCQAESPESKIARGVGDGSEAKFDGLNELMYHAFVEIEFLVSNSLTKHLGQVLLIGALRGRWLGPFLNVIFFYSATTKETI